MLATKNHTLNLTGERVRPTILGSGDLRKNAIFAGWGVKV